jgi:hypothetical protein
MSTITISELRPSFLVDMEASEMTAVFGGAANPFDEYFGVLNNFTGIVFTPVGGTLSNIATALNTAISYAGRNGFVFDIANSSLNCIVV